MKILMVSTISNTINTFMTPHIRMLIENGNSVDVAFKIEQDVNPELIEMGCKIYEIPFSRRISENNFLKLIKDLKKIVKDEGYDVVHTHTPIASAIVRIACKSLPSTKVYYTAHGFHFYKGAPLINWLTYYPIEKQLSKYTEKLITINKEDYAIANKFHAKENIYIPGVGINLKKFNKDDNVNIDYLNDQFKLTKETLRLISIGELNSNKNHAVVLRAIAKINNPNIHYFIAGRGDKEKFLLNLASELEISQQVHLLGFRTDIRNLLEYSDIFIFPSYREGLSVSLMEAMTAGLPIIASRIRGNVDLVDENKGGYLFDPNNLDELVLALSTMIRQNERKELFGEYNMMKIKKFSIESVLPQILEIYKK
ncbi:glycosyltransferase family 4 protein [Aerococcus urinaeequi]|uniref:glycosyltransferase family 4 protein n=1 Tax=Aerococcus urinaeequi TaxID=51665 RepID=UPI003B4F7642